MKKNIKTKNLILIVICFLATFFLATSFAFAYSYVPMEKIPGFETAEAFPDYVAAIYKFGIWTIGIAALLMISIGGFMYITAAGNTSNLEKAKDVIRDAIWGIIAALAAWLLLYVINPDLIRGNISSIQSMEIPPADKNASSGYIPTPGMGPNLGNSWPASGLPPLDDATARSMGIPVNKANCTYIGQSGCTSLDGIPSSTMNNLVNAKNGGINFTITGGTEYWLHKSHGPGKGVVDIVPSASKSEWDGILNRFIDNFGASSKSFCDTNGSKVPCSIANHIHLVF